MVKLANTRHLKCRARKTACRFKSGLGENIMATLKENKSKTILAEKLEPGQVAVLISGNKDYQNKIVQRHKNDLIILGNSDCWTDFFKYPSGAAELFVQVLNEGAIIEL